MKVFRTGLIVSVLGVVSFLISYPGLGVRVLSGNPAWPRRLRCSLFQVLLGILLFSASASAQAMDCSTNQSRALILSGGGSKGAFEAGAVYHLVVHRHCDFKEFSGVSVGALNVSFLAQAATSSDPERSLANLAKQAEALVAVWDAIRGPQDIFKRRFLGMLRFGLFGLENLNDFTPLHNLINDRVSPKKLLMGRTVRVGVVSFWDGRYREVVASKTSEQENQKFLEYIFASSLIPIYGKMPQIQDDPAITDKNQWVQFADAGLRRVTPVSSYFMTCDTAAFPSEAALSPLSESRASCDNQRGKWIPAHENVINQLFVVMASPYSRSSDEVATPNPDDCCQKGTRKFSNGHKILERTISLSMGIPYRWDLRFAQMANEFLTWRQEQHNVYVLAAAPGNPPDFQQKARRLNFPVESYNSGDTAEVPSLPYEISLIAPQKIFADIYGFEPLNIREQLYCGCMAADQVMSKGDPKRSLSVQCALRFPELPEAKKSARDWDSDVCRVIHAQKKHR
jgi:hypothetical protein